MVKPCGSVISVPVFYKSKLSLPVKNAHRETEGRAEPMMMNKESPIHDSDPVAVKKPKKSGHVTHHQLRDEAVTMYSTTVTHNVRECKDNPINEFSINPLISGNHHSMNQETVSSSDLFDARINEIDSALSKFDPIKDPTKSGDIFQVAISLSREKQEQVKSEQFQRKWTRLVRKDTENVKHENTENRGVGNIDNVSAEKRAFSQIGDPSELTCKKKQVLREDEVLFFPLAEASNQPCQE